MPKRSREDEGDDSAERAAKQMKVEKTVTEPVKGTGPPQKSWAPARRQTHKIVKLTPSRPYPSVPLGKSATSSRRAQSLNHFLISRRCTLGSYLRRCKAVVLESNHKTLYLSAMGAAIPLLLQITASLPHVLPQDKSKIEVEVKTGTERVHDELVPLDEDEDISLRSRDKSTLSVVVRIDGGDPEKPVDASKKRRKSQKEKHNRDADVSLSDAMEE